MGRSKVFTESLLTVDQRAALGSLVAETTEMEGTVDVMIAIVTNLSTPQCAVLLEGRMISWKLEALKRLGLQKLKRKAQMKVFAHLVDSLSSLNSERNVAVHGLWQPQGGYTYALLAGITPVGPSVAALKRRNAKSSTLLKADRLEQLAKGVRETHSDFFRFCMEVFVHARVRARRARPMAPA
jgi:hypothetical protein